MECRNEFYLVRNATHHYMQSHIIREADGKILVIDGGTAGDARYLLHRLKQITGQDVPYIAGWFFTHPHSDHMDCFFEVMEYLSDEITFDAIYCHLPPAEYFDYEGPRATVETFQSLLPRFADKLVTVQAGDVVNIGSCSFEVLQTPDLTLTENRGANDASVVIRLHLGSKTIILLGDLGLDGGQRLLNAHGSNLKSDLCQVSHHGQRGCGREVYAAIAPTGCIWTAPDWLWDKKKKEFNFTVNQIKVEWDWMQELGVRDHYVPHSGDVRIEC